MRRYMGFLIFFLLLLLIIPAFSLIGQSPPDKPLWDFPEANPSPLSSFLLEHPEEGAENRFYLVKNHVTGEIMALSPCDYIKGVVAAEMPVSFHTEAMKAQAVAAHTYALRQIGGTLANPDASLEGAYLSTDPARFQAYLSPEERKAAWGSNYETYEQKLTGAVNEVIHQVMVYDGEPILAAFHSISSGVTESAENVWGQAVSYLEPVKSEGDLLSPHYESQRTLSEAEAANTLRSAYPGVKLSEDRDRWFIIGERSEAGNILSMSVGDREVSGREIRELFQLRSADFTVSFQNGEFLFDCVGYGHGVGMSQYGADYLARQGMGYQEILSHYYTGVEFIYTDK